MKKYPAIALLEISSIAGGIHTLDTMIKSAPVSVLKAGSVHNGKYLILVAGSVAAVDEAYNRGLAVTTQTLLDNTMLPDVYPDVYDALQGNRNEMPGDALGVLETRTVASLVEATDKLLKSTDTSLMELRVADDLGGKAVTVITGTLEEVEAAMEIAEASFRLPDVLINRVIIPRIDEEVLAYINRSTWFGKSESLTLKGGEI